MKPFEVLSHLAALGTPPDGEFTARVSAGLGETLARVSAETFPFVAGGGADLQFVHAPYGRGKTHFLKAIEQEARKYGFVTAYVDCKDDESPFKSLVETYRSITRNMTPPGTHRFFGTTGVAKTIEARFAGLNGPAQDALVAGVKSNSALIPDLHSALLDRIISVFI